MKDKPGTLTMLHKDVLQVHPAYQRELVEQKVKQITAEWSWIACGALIVGKRGGDDLGHSAQCHRRCTGAGEGVA